MPFIQSQPSAQLVVGPLAMVVERFPFDATKDNWGLFVVAVIIVVVWLAFRRLLKKSDRP